MSFEQFRSEEVAIQLLQKSLERGRLSHAYLFSGPQLERLEAIATTVAKTLNCQQPVRKPGSLFQSDCCDQCASCRKIDGHAHPDVLWLRPESKSRIITIDQIRDLQQAIGLKPAEAEWKVSILVAADRLNLQAANAFLKTLEEPPPKCALLLLTTEPDRVLETIVSRCLRLIFAGEAAPAAGVSSDAWLAAFSEMAATPDGSLLARYRLLGSLLTKLGEIKGESEKELTARSPLERFDDLEPRLRDKWEDELSAAIEAEYRRRRSELLLSLEWWLRDVWLQAQAIGQELLCFPKLAESARAVGARISAKDALGNIDVLEETQQLLWSNVQEALALEVGLLKLKL